MSDWILQELKMRFDESLEVVEKQSARIAELETWLAIKDDAFTASKLIIEAQGKRIDELESELSRYRECVEIEGHTLRDRFAMSALTGLCGLNWCTKDISNPTVKDHAVQAYRYADAMMEVRKGE